jgi:hypothetical protein
MKKTVTQVALYAFIGFSLISFVVRAIEGNGPPLFEWGGVVLSAVAFAVCSVWLLRELRLRR